MGAEGEHSSTDGGSQGGLKSMCFSEFPIHQETPDVLALEVVFPAFNVMNEGGQYLYK